MMKPRATLNPLWGGANVIDKIDCKLRIGTDIQKYQIALLKALANGWIPPPNMSEEEYISIKDNPDIYPQPLVGYAGFQLSYGSKWFAGYRRDKIGRRNYSREAYRNIMSQADKLKGIRFECCDFRDIPTDVVSNFVIYCDIPYKDTSEYSVKDFPYETFYSWARAMAKHNTVLISEYDMPPDFTCIWQKDIKVRIDWHTDINPARVRTEKLFTIKEDNNETQLQEA